MRRHFKPTTPLLGATLLAALLGGCTSTQAPTQASAAAPSAAAPTAPKPATPTTERANAAVRQTLAAFDPRDFEDATRGGVITSVDDSGIGIGPEHQQRIFDRFYRVDVGRSRAQGGAGLGLALCKTIVDAHGGVLTVARIAMIPNATTQQARFPRNADSQAAYDMVFNALLISAPTAAGDESLLETRVCATCHLMLG